MFHDIIKEYDTIHGDYMPKLVFDNFLRLLLRDVQNNYTSGDRYLTVRQIAEKFNVSLQTSQKGVTNLSEKGILEGRRRAGIHVKSTHIELGISGKKMIVLSNKQDFRFYQAFYKGVKEKTESENIDTELIFNTHPKPQSLGFGEYLTTLEADGIIALSFAKSALPFYHALREGVDIVSDIIIDELPILPAIQTDNYKHANKAGKIMVQNGLKDFYVFGFYPEDNTRYKGFFDAVEPNARSVSYIQLSSYHAMEKVDSIFHDLKSSSAIFSCDYSANYIIASNFLKHHKQITHNNFLAYDAEEEYFHYPGLPPIKCIAPSFSDLGVTLANKLIQKWKLGSFAEPLRIKI